MKTTASIYLILIPEPELHETRPELAYRVSCPIARNVLPGPLTHEWPPTSTTGFHIINILPLLFAAVPLDGRKVCDLPSNSRKTKGLRPRQSDTDHFIRIFASTLVSCFDNPLCKSRACGTNDLTICFVIFRRLCQSLLVHCVSAH
jgi:hypothetical protein